jgi:hypothetical protein
MVGEPLNVRRCRSDYSEKRVYSFSCQVCSFPSGYICLHYIDSAKVVCFLLSLVNIKNNYFYAKNLCNLIEEFGSKSKKNSDKYL